MAATSGKRAFASDVQAIVAASSGKPLLRLVQQASQPLSSDTDTQITFAAGSEDIDTAFWHDVATNTSRVTPTVGGYIRFTGTVWYAADTDLVSIYASIGKNGTIVQRNRLILPATATSSLTRSVTVTCIQSCNGTGDYVELFGRQLQSAAASLSTNVATGFSSTFEAEYLRPL